MSRVTGLRALAAAFLVLAFLGSAAIPLAAQAFEAGVEPAEVKPGDAFVVRVTGAREVPAGSVEGGDRLNFGACGQGCYMALGVLDVDSSPGARRVTVEAGGESATLALRVGEGKFPLQRLTLPEDKVTLSPEDEKRAEMEAVRLRAIFSDVTERMWEGGFVMPLGNSFSTEFGAKRIMNGKKTSVHRGIDIRGRSGEPVKAVNAGRVVLGEDLFYGGNTLVIDHGQGVFSVYMHLSAFDVSPGDAVSKGQVVGRVGATGRATGPHLHLSIKIGQTSANPVSVVSLPL